MDAPPGSASASRVWRPACIDGVVNEAGACWAGRFPRDPRWPGRCCARDATPISALITLVALIVKVGPRRSAWCAGRYPTADRVTRGSAPMHPGAALTTRPQPRGSWFLPQPLVSAAENWAALRTSCHSCPQGSVPSELAFRVSLPSFRASARGVSETPFRGCRSRPRSIQEADRRLPFPIPILRTGGDAVSWRSASLWMALAPDPTGAFHDEPSIREQCRRGAAGRRGSCAQGGAACAPEACSRGRALGAGEHRGAGDPGGARPRGAAARGARRWREVRGIRGSGERADPSGSRASEPCRCGASSANEDAGELAPWPCEERVGRDR